MKVLFIEISVGTDYHLFYSEGIGSIAAVLKDNNIKVDLFCFYDWENFKALKERIILYKPDVIAFSPLTATFKATKKIASFIKKEFPKIVTVCGGTHITLNPSDFYKASSLDAICLGDGEYSFLEFLKKLEKRKDYSDIKGFWFRKNNRIIKNPKREVIRNIDELPFGARDIFLKEGAFWRYESFGESVERGICFLFARGCPFDCTYCCNHALKKFYGATYFRCKSPLRAIKEIKKVVKDNRPDFLQFYDDTFTLNEKWLDSFLSKYKKINIPFFCNVRVETCTKRIFSKLKKAGCRLVLIGLESGDYDLRKNVLNRPMTNIQLIDAFRWAKESGLQTFAFVMIGFPGETPKKFMNTLKLINIINPDKCALSVFNPYIGTKLFKVCKKNKLLRKNIEENFMERTDSILNIPKFPREDILHYYHNFNSLVNLGKKSSFSIRKVHRKILYFLLFKPPSYKLFFVYQFLLALDHASRLFTKTIFRAIAKNKIYYYE